MTEQRAEGRRDESGDESRALFEERLTAPPGPEQVKLSTLTAVPSIGILLFCSTPTITKDSSSTGGGNPTLLLQSPDAPALRWRCSPSTLILLERFRSVVAVYVEEAAARPAWLHDAPIGRSLPAVVAKLLAWDDTQG